MTPTPRQDLDRAAAAGDAPHAHSSVVPGCFRCEWAILDRARVFKTASPDTPWTGVRRFGVEGQQFRTHPQALRFALGGSPCVSVTVAPAGLIEGRFTDRGVRDQGDARLS